MLNRVKKYEPIARLVIGVVHDKYFVLRRQSMTRLYDFVGITCFGYVILIRHNCLVSMLEVLLFFMSTLNFYLESFGYEYSYHN